MFSETAEVKLIAAWEAANRAWQADPFNPDKERAVNDAAFALRQWRRWNTPEGRAYADSPKTYKDDGDDGTAE
jgi:hypothetical protein